MWDACWMDNKGNTDKDGLSLKEVLTATPIQHEQFIGTNLIKKRSRMDVVVLLHYKSCIFPFFSQSDIKVPTYNILCSLYCCLCRFIDLNSYHKLKNDPWYWWSWWSSKYWSTKREGIPNTRVTWYITTVFLIYGIVQKLLLVRMIFDFVSTKNGPPLLFFLHICVFPSNVCQNLSPHPTSLIYEYNYW